jgi:hypothetical protein
MFYEPDQGRKTNSAVPPTAAIPKTFLNISEKAEF